MTTRPIHPDGIYFGLPEEIYHRDPAIGSSDLKLLKQGPEFYWTEKNKPVDPDAEEKAFLRFGRAVHKFVLEGEGEFALYYCRAPSDVEGMCKTDADLAALLRPYGDDPMFPKAKDGKPAMPREKAAKLDLARVLGLAGRCLDIVVADAQADGFTVLPPEEYDRAVGAAREIMANPDLATAFVGGFAEVSIFWTVDVDGFPVRKKCRVDYLKRRALGDLKSIGHTRGLPFEDACRAQIAGLRYDIQAEHYFEGRSMVPVFMEREHPPVFDYHRAIDVDDRLDFLQEVADADAYGWGWVFFHNGDAPLVWGAVISPGNPILDVAREDIEAALATFVEFSRAFPEGEQWRKHRPVAELELADLPGWFGAKKRGAS